MKTKKYTPKNPNISMDFKASAYSDYIAARVLLNNCLLTQGAILASTAIEKYIKTLLALNGNISHGHLKNSHKTALENLAPEIYNAVDKEFLDLCQHCYAIRYKDSIAKNFNIVIAQREFLSELDEFVSLFENSIEIHKDGEKQVCRYHQGEFEKDIRLLHNNFVFQNKDKSKFIYESHQYIYELRRTKSGVILEMEYSSRQPPIRKGFLREGAPTDDDKTFSLAFPRDV